MVTIQVPLSSEEQEALAIQAYAAGVSVDALLRKAVLAMISSNQGTSPPVPLSPEEFDRAFEEIADMIPPDVPSISDEDLQREKIYTREDEWNRQ